MHLHADRGARAAVVDGSEGGEHFGAFGQQLQQLTQLLAPRTYGPEQRQRLAQGQPMAERAEQLSEEHGPLAPLALVQGLGIGGRGSS